MDEKTFLAQVDQLAVDAFDDQCTGANPRYPLIAELKQILLDTYYGRPYQDKGDISEDVAVHTAAKGVASTTKKKAVKKK